MQIEDVRLFTQASMAGSLSEAARRLGIAPMAASRRLSALEAELGTRLLQRTTRSLSLTPEGEAFLPYARAMIESADQAVARLNGRDGLASGLLRVSLPITFARKVVVPALPALLDQNPDLEIDLQMTDSMPDLVAGGIDVALRIARLRDSSLIARKIADSPRAIVAAPAYLDRAGRPRVLADLAGHEGLLHAGRLHWTFATPTGERTVRPRSRLRSSSIEGSHVACLAGGGIAVLAEWNVADDIAQGRLERITLDDARPELIGIWALYPTAVLLPPKVRIFVDAVQRRFHETMRNLPAEPDA